MDLHVLLSHFSAATDDCSFNHTHLHSRREFARTIPRPFSVRYNPYTQSVEVIKDKPSMEKVLNDVRYELDVLQDAIGKYT